MDKKMGNPIDDEEDEFLYHYPDLVMGKHYGNENTTYDPDIEYVTAPIDALGPPGRWIRHRLLESILYGTPVLVAIQQLRNKSLTKFMKFASILGTEEFYALLLCFLIWIVDMRLGRLACIAMGIGFYAANAVKNALCLPRPPSPPVKPLENAYCTWGLPSHHSVLGVVCPWYIWFYCLLHYHFQPLTLVCFFTVICSWSFVVLFCRIYNGVHSPADVVAGGLLGCFIVAFMNRYDSMIDLSSVMNGQNALILPVWLAILLVLHPFNAIGIPAFEETTSMTCCGVGFMLGRAFSHGGSTQLKALLETYTPGESSILWLIVAGVLRYVIGAVLVVLTKVTLKFVMQLLIGTCLKLCNVAYITKSPKHNFYTGYSENFLLPPIYKDKKKGSDDDTELDEDEREEKQQSNIAKDNEPWNISHHVRFISYVGMGFTAYYCNTLLCQNMGLVL